MALGPVYLRHRSIVNAYHIVILGRIGLFLSSFLAVGGLLLRILLLLGFHLLDDGDHILAILEPCQSCFCLGLAALGQGHALLQLRFGCCQLVLGHGVHAGLGIAYRTGTVIVIVEVLLVLLLGGSQFAAFTIEVLEQVTGLGSVLQHLLIGIPVDTHQGIGFTIALPDAVYHALDIGVLRLGECKTQFIKLEGHCQILLGEVHSCIPNPLIGSLILDGTFQQGITAGGILTCRAVCSIHILYIDAGGYFLIVIAVLENPAGAAQSTGRQAKGHCRSQCHGREFLHHHSFFPPVPYRK